MSKFLHWLVTTLNNYNLQGPIGRCFYGVRIYSSCFHWSRFKPRSCQNSVVVLKYEILLNGNILNLIPNTHKNCFFFNILVCGKSISLANILGSFHSQIVHLPKVVNVVNCSFSLQLNI